MSGHLRRRIPQLRFRIHRAVRTSSDEQHTSLLADIDAVLHEALGELRLKDSRLAQEAETRALGENILRALADGPLRPTELEEKLNAPAPELALALRPLRRPARIILRPYGPDGQPADNGRARWYWLAEQGTDSTADELKPRSDEDSHAHGRIRLVLADTLTPTGIEQWMHARNRLLDGRRPIEALDEGDNQAVEAAARAFVDGSYL